ncbi:MAG: hypothetical protein AAB467_04230 [Patescibacteria group bacterium]
MNPTFEQLAEFHEKVRAGRITRGNFQAFLRNPSSVFQDGFPVTYDQSGGPMPLIKLALGEDNLGNINPDITQERFPLRGTGARSVKCRVEAFLDGETGEQAAKRLTDAGHVLGNTGDLAGFMHDHPEEVEKWPGWVLAISEDSRWADPDGHVGVPCAFVDGAFRYFGLGGFRVRFDSDYGVLVLSE